MDKKIFRIIDANLNRSLEGLRVCEEITRFILANKKLTYGFKNLRHSIVESIKAWNIDNCLLLNFRNSAKDVGRASIESELKRLTYQDIFFANIQRAKESIRVLEEFSKLNNLKASAGFKNIRYSLYQLEKNTYPRLWNIRGN